MGGWPVRQIHKYLLSSLMLLRTPPSAFSCGLPPAPVSAGQGLAPPSACPGLCYRHLPCFILSPPLSAGSTYHTSPPLPCPPGARLFWLLRPLSSHHFWKPAGPHRPLPHTRTLQISLWSLKCLFPLSNWIAKHFQGRERISEP